jgi:putative salt-induced outer membrane protein YdiY
MMRMTHFGIISALVLTASASFAADPVPTWHGNVALNFAQINTAANTRSLTVFGAAKRETKTTTTTVDQTYINARQKTGAAGAVFNTTDDSWIANGNHSFKTGERTNGFINARLQTDKVQKLNLRSILGAGLGVLVRKTEVMSFKTSVGVAGIREGFKGRAVSNKFSGQFAYNYTRKLREGTNFTNDFTIYPNLSKTSDNYYVAQFSLDQALAGNFFANIRYITDRTSIPAAGTPKTTSRLIFGVGTKF